MRKIRLCENLENKMAGLWVENPKRHISAIIRFWWTADRYKGILAYTYFMVSDRNVVPMAKVHRNSELE